MSSKDYKARKNQISSELNDTVASIETGHQEAVRVRQVIENTPQILDDLDERFKRETGLTSTDIVFLFLAVGLQIARQYLLSNETYRLTHTQGDSLVYTALSLAPPNWRDVLTQSVPYDAFATGPHATGTGLGGNTHRYRTLGHDPIFGWIFGTANIMTNSLTKTNFETYQVKNMCIVRHYPLGVVGMMEKAISFAQDDPMLLAASLARQAIHFGSDFFTKQGLPVPIIATVNNNLAQQMVTKWHIDMYSITRGMALSAFINTLISLIHGLFFTGTNEMDRKLYEVRTRKIISYSNLIATSSNMAVVAVTGNMQKLDVGGMAVTIYRLITDAKFIREVKEEFIFGNYRQMIMGESF